MELEDLDQHERLALVALIKAIVFADRRVSADEAELLPEIIAAIGEDAYRRTFTIAAERFGDETSLKTFLATIERQEARDLIYETLGELAASDGVSREEQALLGWLGATWSIDGEVPPPAQG
jgi:uncharacterized tellurite resistance protein B-like protein